MTDEFAGVEFAGLENDGLENEGLENDGLDVSKQQARLTACCEPRHWCSHRRATAQPTCQQFRR